MKKVLIISAHPDDEVLGCGGILSKYKDSDISFKVLFIGEGSSCRYEDPYCKDSLSDIKERNKFAVEALNFLGVDDVEFTNLPCGRLDKEPILKINKIIEKTIQDFRPDTVFTHSIKDANSDHRIIFNSSIMATRPCNHNVVKNLYSYEVLSSSEWMFVESFAPNMFIELSATDVKNKCEAMDFYKSEIRNYPFPRSSKAIKAHSMLRGTQAGFNYAEAFFLIRKFIS